MVKDKTTCPNCHLVVDKDNEKCPYCGEALPKEEDVKKKTKKAVDKPAGRRGLRQHSIFYLIGLGIELFCISLMTLPGETIINQPIFFWAFSSTNFTFNEKTFIIGTNAATICFIFTVVAILNSAALFRSIQKKSTEIPLFSYFTAFYCIVVGIVAFLAPILMSNNAGGDKPTQFTVGVGFILVGIFSLAAAVMNIIGVIKYKKFLVASPLETFKTNE